MKNDRNGTNFKTQIINKKRKIKCIYKSPDKIHYKTKNDYKDKNRSNYNYNPNAFQSLNKN